MSRRKQPKPAKRDACESPNNPSLLANPELPVYLKQFGGESLLLAKEVLKAGTVLGTYRGTPVQAQEDQGEDIYLKVNRPDGGSPVHVMLEDGGHWMKLMRTATLPTDANICLRISGKDIVCTVTKDVNKEVELKVTCRIADPCHDQKLDQCQLSEKERLKSPGAQKHTEVEPEELESVPNDCTSPKAMLDCVSNSVCSYSETVACSRSTCNSREVSEERSLISDSVEVESDIDMEDFREEVSSSTFQESPSSDPVRDIRIKSEDEKSRMNVRNSDCETRKNCKVSEESSQRRGTEYEYPNADLYHYSRLQYSPNSPSTSSNLTNPKSFCNACKIQFMSVNTYQVHKKFYCKSRHENEDLISTVPVLETTSGSLSAAFKPSADTVILRGGMNGNVSSSVIQPQAIFAAISTNPLILLPCTLVPGQGLVPQNGVLPAAASRIGLQSGITCSSSIESPSVKATESSFPPRKTSHPALNTGDDHNDSTLLSSSKIASLKRKISEGGALNLKKTCTASEAPATVSENSMHEQKDINVDEDSPLDLSVKMKKGDDNAPRISPMRRRSSVISIVSPTSPLLRGSGSPPGLSQVASAPSPTSSYSSESTCFVSQVPVVHRVPSSVSERISPLPPVLQSVIGDKPIPAPGMLPPKLMKQGNNICEECHIVFIKYDNLVTHKKHYCAYRRRQLSAMAAAAAAAALNQEQSSDDNNSNHSGMNEGTSSFSAEDSKPGMRKLEYGVEHYRQVIPKPPQYLCDACGVRFSTSDTLEAHQTYYCMKKSDCSRAKASNRNSDGSSSPNVESPFSGPEEWKCNYCDATCSSYETIRRHLLTHNEPRGYRCLICGYKGNTWRGMRTHASEHLAEDSSSVEEFMSSTVIGETGIMPPIPQNSECSDEDSEPQRDVINYRNRERTSSNNSDVTKDESLKNERLVREHSEMEEHSNSPRNAENIQKEIGSKRMASVKDESGDSSSDVSGHQEMVNPIAFCDVVIKMENDQNASSDDSVRNEVKFQNERENNNNEKPPTCQPRSVICVAEKHEDLPQPSFRRKVKSETKSNSDAKSCKSCGVSFQHLSNLLTHKKFYCNSRSLQTRLPETATVQ